MDGYAGKILRVDLSTRSTSIIDTEDYREWGGGHGIGSALFWDLCEDKTVSGFDPGNVLVISTSPLGGTLAPSAGRCEVQGIGVQSSPEWFTRANFGGRFATMLKFAGWDAIVLEGAADSPVWLDIRDDEVVFADAEADGLWGLDTWATQERIWEIAERDLDGESGWVELGSAPGKRSALKSAVLTIGQAGENQSRTGALIHDAGSAAGQGGFGGIWGAKNLKAISVMGSGGIEVANPAALMEARMVAREEWGQNADDPASGWSRFGGNPSPAVMYSMPKDVGSRPQACQGCIAACRAHFSDGIGNESSCDETYFYYVPDLTYNKGVETEGVRISADLCQQYGINAYELGHGLHYLHALHKRGVVGPGEQIDLDLDWENYGSVKFIEDFARMIAYREGLGDDMAEGFWRAAEKWGRLEEDSADGTLEYSCWGLPEHGYDPRAEAYWGYGTMLGDRDINEHDLNHLFWKPSIAMWYGMPPWMEAEEFVTAITDRLLPYEGNPNMVNFAEDNVYSEDMAKLTMWHRHYTRFWKESALYCDYRFADFTNANREDKGGYTPVGEPLFWNAVTGDDMSFTDGVELGRRIWNLDNAIWTLQGRHRDMVEYSKYMYDVPYGGHFFGPYYMPVKNDEGAWEYGLVNGRVIDREKFNDFKSTFYALEGWDAASGWPTRETLEDLDLKHVADALEDAGRIGGQ